MKKMKKSVWFITIIAIAVLTGIFSSLRTSVVDIDTIPIDLLKNATIAAPESNDVIQLIDGRGEYMIAPDSASKERVHIVDSEFALWKHESRTDITAILTSQSGGSGVFYYLVLFDVSGNIITKKSEVFLGDRIEVTHIGVGELVHDAEADYRITVQTRIRKKDESFAAEPTVLQTRTFYVTDQILEEIEGGRDDS